MQIIRYDKTQKIEWDNFVRESKNGTFLFYRDFMDYHSDRFSDYSLMFYEKDTLLAILPANINGNTVYSHQGLTYGGLLLSTGTKSLQVLSVFSNFISYAKANNIKTLIYKAIPHIYHRMPSDEDLYALHSINANLISRSISSTIDLSCPIGYAQLRKRQVKKAMAQNIEFAEVKHYKQFWSILEQNLMERHNTKPVHSIAEIESLMSKFPQNIRLFCALKEGRTLAGCLVFETETVAHLQYISANDEGKQDGALDFLFDKLINEVFSHKKYFDFGISTEDEGRFLNEGLISQKEGFGARGIIYDTYAINI